MLDHVIPLSTEYAGFTAPAELAATNLFSPYVTLIQVELAGNAPPATQVVPPSAE